MHDELTEDYRDMIYADTAAEIETRRKAFLRKWRLKCRAVADSLEEAGDRLFAFTRLEKRSYLMLLCSIEPLALQVTPDPPTSTACCR
jgi:transposase-like protein